MIERIRLSLISVLGIGLSLFTLSEVNYQFLNPLSQLAVFAMLGMVLCFLNYPILTRWKSNEALRVVDFLFALLSVACCSYLIIQGSALGQRAGAYTALDITVAITGIVLVLESTRRSIGLALPVLAALFFLYALIGPHLPDWLFPHRGYSVGRVASQTFLRTEGVFGTALRVMFTYVYLFVLFGTFLEVSGATQFIVNFAQRMFSNRSGGAAKVAVLGSGLMGSLSGSAVANAVTTGTFTIPMMRSSGFKPHIAAGITAAAASGGALVPPVMGAGAYMMLEIVEPPVTFVQIAKAALIPAILYYFSIFLIVHFYGKRAGADSIPSGNEARSTVSQPSLTLGFFSLEGIAFFGALTVLIGLLISGKSPVFAVTASLGFILLLMIPNARIQVSRMDRTITWCLIPIFWVAIKFLLPRITDEPIPWSNAGIFTMTAILIAGLAHSGWRPVIAEALVKSAKTGVSLVSAAACVGIVIGVVTLTGVGTAFPNAIIPLANESLFLALVAIMACSILLGMGLPSAVCYLLMATLIGPVLNKLGVPPLAAHLFIFYFGMMSMVTPPVALAAYASASIAGSSIMQTSFAAFRFALVGFTLPFMFIYRPELLLLPGGDQGLVFIDVILSVGAAVVGIVSLAGGISGFLFTPLAVLPRVSLFLAAIFALFPDQRFQIGGMRLAIFDILGAALLVTVAIFNWRAAKQAESNGELTS